ncbi:MAG: hypothetical protein SFU91_10700 [Chloroherpetonaceae bacterium]|nr:hypothetical protein [Chloroherpetonaceae bacterium]
MRNNPLTRAYGLLVAILLFLTHTDLQSQSQFPEKPVLRGKKTASVVNDRLIQTISEESFSNQSSSESSQTSKKTVEPESRFILPTAVQSGDLKPFGFSTMASFGMAFSRVFNVGGMFQMGYTFPFGLYLGTSGLLFNQFNSGVPVNPAFGVDINQQNNLGSSVFAGSAGADIGYELKFKAISENLFSRIYIGGGFVYGFGRIIEDSQPSSPTSQYLTFGNTFFYQFGRIPLLQNMTIGVDIRYFQFVGTGTTGAYFSIGRRF